MKKAAPTPAQVFKSLNAQSMNDIVKLHYHDSNQDLQTAKRSGTFLRLCSSVSYRLAQEEALVDDVMFNGLGGFVKALSKTLLDQLAISAGITEVANRRGDVEKLVVDKLDDMVLLKFFLFFCFSFIFLFSIVLILFRFFFLLSK